MTDQITIDQINGDPAKVIVAVSRPQPPRVQKISLERLGHQRNSAILSRDQANQMITDIDSQIAEITAELAKPENVALIDAAKPKVQAADIGIAQPNQLIG